MGCPGAGLGLNSMVFVVMEQGWGEVALVVKYLPAGMAGDTELIPGWDLLGVGNGNPLQYSCPEKPVDRGA